MLFFRNSEIWHGYIYLIFNKKREILYHVAD